MYCPNCGQQQSDNAKFCNNCGSAIQFTPTPPSATQSRNAQSVPYAIPIQKPSSMQNVPVNQQPPVQPALKRRKAWYQRWWIWVIVGVVITSLGASFGRRSDGSTLFSESKNVPIPTSSTAKATEPKSVYTAGESFDDDGLIIKFVSSEYYDYPADAAPDQGFDVIKADFELFNNSSFTRNFGEKFFKCYADNKPVDIWYSYDDDMHRFAYNNELSVNREFKGCLYFEVPDNALTIEIEYQPVGGFFSDPKPIIFKVK